MCVGRLKIVSMCSNKVYTHGKACVSRVELGHMWSKSNSHSREGLWFVQVVLFALVRVDTLFLF